MRFAVTLLVMLVVVRPSRRSSRSPRSGGSRSSRCLTCRSPRARRSHGRSRTRTCSVSRTSSASDEPSGARPKYPQFEQKPADRARKIAAARQFAGFAHRGEPLLAALAILTALALVPLTVPWIAERIAGWSMLAGGDLRGGVGTRAAGHRRGDVRDHRRGHRDRPAARAGVGHLLLLPACGTSVHSALLRRAHGARAPGPPREVAGDRARAGSPRDHLGALDGCTDRHRDHLLDLGREGFVGSAGRRGGCRQEGRDSGAEEARSTGSRCSPTGCSCARTSAGSSRRCSARRCSARPAPCARTSSAATRGRHRCARNGVSRPGAAAARSLGAQEAAHRAGEPCLRHCRGEDPGAPDPRGGPRWRPRRREAAALAEPLAPHRLPRLPRRRVQERRQPHRPRRERARAPRVRLDDRHATTTTWAPCSTTRPSTSCSLRGRREGRCGEVG